MTSKMPVLFIGHGSPMNAIEKNEFSQSWKDIGRILATPRAILAISAHWETRGTQITAMEKPRTIHDFYGFPRQLFEITYPAPGSPDLAQSIKELSRKAVIQPDLNWGLDHGTWSVLVRMFPKAKIPVVQLSLDRLKTPLEHYQLGQQLKELREQGILVIGSGNIVHNLQLAVFDENLKFDWAEAFDRQVKELIDAGDHESLINYDKLGQTAARAINSAEHYLPLLYTLGLKDEIDPITYFAEKVTLGSISMRSIKFG